jgi:hypothetical protein
MPPTPQCDEVSNLEVDTTSRVNPMLTPLAAYLLVGPLDSNSPEACLTYRCCETHWQSGRIVVVSDPRLLLCESNGKGVRHARVVFANLDVNLLEG